MINAETAERSPGVPTYVCIICFSTWLLYFLITNAVKIVITCLADNIFFNSSLIVLKLKSLPVKMLHQSQSKHHLNITNNPGLFIFLIFSPTSFLPVVTSSTRPYEVYCRVIPCELTRFFLFLNQLSQIFFIFTLLVQISE